MKYILYLVYSLHIFIILAKNLDLEREIYYLICNIHIYIFFKLKINRVFEL